MATELSVELLPWQQEVFEDELTLQGYRGRTTNR